MILELAHDVELLLAKLYFILEIWRPWSLIDRMIYVKVSKPLGRKEGLENPLSFSIPIQTVPNHRQMETARPSSSNI